MKAIAKMPGPAKSCSRFILILFATVFTDVTLIRVSSVPIRGLKAFPLWLARRKLLS